MSAYKCTNFPAFKNNNNLHKFSLGPARPDPQVDPTLDIFVIQSLF